MPRPARVVFDPAHMLTVYSYWLPAFPHLFYAVYQPLTHRPFGSSFVVDQVQLQQQELLVADKVAGTHTAVVEQAGHDMVVAGCCIQVELDMVELDMVELDTVELDRAEILVNVVPGFDKG